MNLNLVVEDVSNEITVKNENANDSLDADISRLAANINQSDDKSDHDFDVDMDADTNDRLSDKDVLNLPIQYFKPQDLECRKKL